MLDVNLTGPKRFFRAAIPEIPRNEHGVFVTIASVGGLFGSRAGTAYTASKHGVIGLAKSVGCMLHVRPKRDPLQRYRAGRGQHRDRRRQGDEPRGSSIAMSGLALNPRTGEPEEIARVALFLASDEASFVNGATIVADAGWTSY